MKKYFFLLFLCFQAQAQKKESYQSLNNYFDTLGHHNRFMGNALILKGEKVVFEKSIGWQSIDQNKKLNSQSIFRIGSITKSYTATLIMKLVELGSINLDTKLSSFNKQIKNADKITIKQMLNHSSGMANYTAQEDFGSYINKHQSVAEMIARIEKLPSDFEPGTKHDYSNTNYLLLGYIAENISGKSYDQLLNEYILKPLKLYDTYYQMGTQLLQNESNSYVRTNNWKTVPRWNLDVAGAAGAMRSTTKDLAFFARGLFQNKILKPTSVQQMQDLQEGYGLGMFEVPFKDKKANWHNGKIEGYLSYYYHFPKDDITIVLLGNGVNYKMTDITKTMGLACFGEAILIPNFKEKEEVEVSTEILKGYEANYATSNFPLDIKVFMKNDKLFGQATGQMPFPLKAIDDNEFVFKSAMIKMKFIKQSNGSYDLKFNQAGQEILFQPKK